MSITDAITDTRRALDRVDEALKVQQSFEVRAALYDTTDYLNYALSALHRAVGRGAVASA